MKVIEASAVIHSYTPLMEENIEFAGRKCWKSEDRIEDGSACEFIERIKGKNHASVLEHGAVTVHFVVDRGVSHELVRHRLASFSQESTRYCNYSKGKFGQEITVIKPCFWNVDSPEYNEWYNSCLMAEASYFRLLAMKAKAQEARSVLPNSLKTEVVMTTNPREWQHVFNMRCAEGAHPQMREIMIPLRAKFMTCWPSLFTNSEKEA